MLAAANDVQYKTIKPENTMEIDTILEKSRRDTSLDGHFGFKINNDFKDRFFAVCQAEHLSTGAVVRELLNDFVTQYENQS